MEYLEGVPLSHAIEQEQTRMAKALGKQSAQELRDDLRKFMRDHFESPDKAPRPSFMNVMAGPFAARLFRIFVGAKEGIDQTVGGLKSAPAKVLRALLHGGSPTLHQHDPPPPREQFPINLNRVLKILIQVHGLQMLKDGTYNADPHPGNVLVMSDGRLGLLDYGMVVELTESDRRNVSQVVLALANKDKHEAARLYMASGYRTTWREGPIDDPGVLHRFATWHLDRMDMSPVPYKDGHIEFADLMHSFKEHNIPVWIESARRLSALLMGVSAQVGRPMPLSKEWKSIAQQVVREENQEEPNKMK
jgi:hypothetical protein